MKSLNQFINEAISVPEYRDSDSQIVSVIASAMRLTIQAHVWHLLTKSYSSHEAIGDFYETLTEQIDTLAEQYLATGGTLTGSSDMTIEYNYDRTSVLTQLTDFRSGLSSTITSLDSSATESIKDTLIAMQKLVDKTAYLLDLN